MSDVRERPVARSARTEQTLHPIRKIGVVGAGQMGNGIAHVCALSGLHVMLNDIAPERITEGLATISGNLARQVSRQRISEEQRQTALKHITAAKTCRRTRRLRSRHRGGDRKGRRQAQGVRHAVPGAQTRGDRRHQHLVDLDHAARRRDRPAGAFHRHSFHESGAADGAGRGDPRHRHRRRHVRGYQTVHRQARQADRGIGGFSRLHRQSHPAADDQRGDLHAVRGRRQRRGDRHRDAARRASSDGAARACRFHRARHLPLGHAGAARGPGRLRNTGRARSW